MRVANEAGEEVAHDGKEMGELLLRGAWVVEEYYRDPRSSDKFSDGWLKTGDMATIDEEGYVQIVDRTRDLIKSGGEWISSVDLENAIMAHPAVLEDAVIAIPHEKWGERPFHRGDPQDQHRQVQQENSQREIPGGLSRYFDRPAEAIAFRSGEGDDDGGIPAPSSDPRAE